MGKYDLQSHRFTFHFKSIKLYKTEFNSQTSDGVWNFSACVAFSYDLMYVQHQAITNINADLLSNATYTWKSAEYKSSKNI